MASHWPISILTSLSALVNMLVPLLMVRLIPQEQVGLFRAFYLYVTMMPVFSLMPGLGSGLAYWAGQGERGRKAIQLSNGITLAAGIALSSLCLAASPWISSTLHWPVSYSVYFAACTLGAVCINFFEESLVVTGRVWYGAVFGSSAEIVRSAVIVLTAWFTRDVGAILAACAALAIVKVATGVLLSRRMQLFGLRKLMRDRELFRGVWKYSLPVSTAWLFGAFAKNADQLVLAAVIPPAQFAIYTVCCLTVPPLMIIEQSITRVLIPQLSESFAQGKSERAARTYRDAVEQLAWLLIPAVTGLIVFAHPIIELLFTSKYTAGTIFLRWYALSYLLLIFPEDAIPRARGEGGWIFRTFMLFTPIPLALCYGLGMKFAALGALGGWLLSRVLFKLYALGYVKRTTGWKLGEFLPFGEMAAFTVTSLALAALSVALKPYTPGGLLWFLSCGGLFTALYFPLSLLLINFRRRRRPLGETRPGRILLVTQHLGVGGLERLVLTLGQTLKRESRWEVFLFSHDSDENADAHTDRTLVGEFLRTGIPVDAMKKGSGISFRALYRLVRNIYRNNIDVIHSHDLGALVYAVLANFLSLGRVRIVHTQHSFVYVESIKRQALYKKFLTRFVDRLTVVNDSLVGRYAELGVAENRVQVVHNGVSFLEAPARNREAKLERRAALLASLPEKDRALLAPYSADNWILYLARLSPVKGQRDAAPLWTALSPELRRKSVLVIVGPETEKNERNYVLEAFAGVPDRDRVILLGGTRAPQEWLATSDLFLSCSRIEGMPLGPLEAIGSGLPAVLSGIPGHGFLASVSGLYSPASPAEGAARVSEALSEPGFGTEAYYLRHWDQAEWIRGRFSLQAMASRYASLYAGEALET